MVMRRMPADFNFLAWSASSTPLVVIAKSCKPLPSPTFALITSMIAARSERISGSPPVSRILSTPTAINASTIRLISSTDSRSARGNQAYSASGMQ
ncbi:Uncharacterised protein [Mycobacterium tuberculosis]|uniref:Uncharacterized protein n=1 Tax=Mycobacterium tuberculosis TaxID=1773 RepID=A0A916L812_MYCTX|nr:Uncharacterised protein [Mycobacterium tuberculosis]COX00326.1 Uncharacterised protein [Mycobacterium tuberculosis]COX49420.1 Uncharacterised protein [Mycobacterium tuberculosis]